MAIAADLLGNAEPPNFPFKSKNTLEFLQFLRNSKFKERTI